MTFPKEGYSAAVIYLKFFKPLSKHYDKQYQIDMKLFKKIVYLFNKKLAAALLKGAVALLPYGLGELRIRKKPLNTKVAKLNIQLYMKTGEKTRHFNEHSDGFRGQYYWKKQDTQVAGSYMFAFVPTDTNKKELARVMKTLGGHKNFME